MLELDVKTLSGVTRPFPLYWVTTMSDNGPDIAPMATLTGLTHYPLRLIMAINPKRRTYRNLENNPELVASIPFGDTETLDTLWDSAWGGFRDGENKFDILGIESHPSKAVKPPRPKHCIASIEMRVIERLWPKESSGADRPVLVLEPLACSVNPQYYDTSCSRYLEGAPIPLHFGGNKFSVLGKEILAGPELRSQKKALHGKEYHSYISTDDTTNASKTLLEKIRRHRS